MNSIDYIEGWTWHGRKGDLDNSFRYSIDYILCDPEAAIKMPWPFQRNSGYLFSLHDRDHGGTPKQGTGVAWVRDVLRSYEIELTGKVQLLAQPKILGHVFNPVSFWLCHNADDQLCAVIAEVTNTFGDRHSYLCHHEDLRPIKATDHLFAKKIFHVSPFQPIEGEYKFRFDIRPDKLGIWIDLAFAGGGVMANLTGKRQNLTTGKMLRALLRRPLGSRRILALIHWQALKLWWKGAKYREPPTPPHSEVS